MADDPKQTGTQDDQREPVEPSVLRAATDELGITTPEEAHRLRRKGLIRVQVYKDQKSGTK
jgi:hypothetical protein